MTIEKKVLEILSEIRPEVDFSASGDFLEDGLIDSFDLISMVSDIDSKFGISIDGTKILPENFNSLQAIVNLIKEYGVTA